MAQLSAYEEARLSKPLNQFWASFDNIFGNERDLHLSFDEDSQPSVWQDLIISEKESLYDAIHGYSCLDSYTNFESENDFKSSDEVELHPESPKLKDVDAKAAGVEDVDTKIDSLCILDGSTFGDIPAVYSICGLRPQELPVKGTFVHPKIVPGFRYVVRPVDSEKLFFQGKPLCLLRIGMGYGKRLTFSSDSLTNNENYFWSDSNPEGYGFSLSLIHKSDTFILKDANNVPIANAEVIEVLGEQIETEHRIKSRKIEKEAKVCFRCDLHYFEEIFPTHDTAIISGTAVAIKDPKSKKAASVLIVKNCKLNGEKGFVLVSSNERCDRSKLIEGSSFSDIPTSYSITGLLDHEVPVVGTIVDPRVAPGFKYKVRPLDSKKCLFEGVALPLLSIGKGYAKRLNFAGQSLTQNDNYFWSDTNPAGYGFTLEAVSEGEEFRIEDREGTTVGRARVYRTDKPQKEIKSEVINGVYTKKVRVCLSCHLSIYGEADLTTAVTGIAIVERRSGAVNVSAIEDVAISAQMNELFADDQRNITLIKE